MRYIVGLLAIFVLALAVLLAKPIGHAIEARTAYAEQQRALALERERLELERQRALAPMAATADLILI